MRVAGAFGVTIWVALALAVPAPAEEAGVGQLPQANQVRIAYEPPKDPAHQQLYELLRERRVLETLRQLLGPFRLPRELTIKLESCDGDPNAFYEDDIVTLCYEYLDDAWRNAPTKTTSSGVSPIDAVLGPLYDTFLHEVGHALFDLLKIPVFGREEEAADQVSAYMILQLGKEEARRLVLGAAYAYRIEAGQSLVPYAFIALGLLMIVVGALVAWHRWWLMGGGGALAAAVAIYLAVTNIFVTRQQFSDDHGTPAQRFYNLLCIAYGADAQLFADVVQKGFLPKKRAESCDDEYRQVAYAFQTLISPHMDQEQAQTVMQRSWLPDVTTRLPPRGSTRSVPRPK